jgi:hypothetical protein
VIDSRYSNVCKLKRKQMLLDISWKLYARELITVLSLALQIIWQTYTRQPPRLVEIDAMCSKSLKTWKRTQTVIPSGI